jgi:hypothetical protein
MLKRVYNLIGIDDDESLLPAAVAERVNPTEGAGIPDDLLGELEKIYGDEVTRLRDQGLI